MNNQFQEKLLSELVNEIHRRLIGESIPRLIKCLQKLSQEEIWFRPNENTVSVGNLCLHLCGNVRQWLVSGIGGETDLRNRPKEFEEQGPLDTNFLIEDLNKLETQIKKVLENLAIEDLLRKRSVQIYEESALSILIHVVEHFSYHVGQVTYYVKSRKNVDLMYYPDIK